MVGAPTHPVKLMMQPFNCVCCSWSIVVKVVLDHQMAFNQGVCHVVFKCNTSNLQPHIYLVFRWWKPSSSRNCTVNPQDCTFLHKHCIWLLSQESWCAQRFLQRFRSPVTCVQALTQTADHVLHPSITQRNECMSSHSCSVKAHRRGETWFHWHWHAGCIAI